MMKIIRLALATGLGVALVVPIGAQQSDPSGQGNPSIGSLATPSPTASPGAPHRGEHKKHRRRHRERRQERTRNQNQDGTVTRQRRQEREREQNGVVTEQRREEQSNGATTETRSEERTTPEDVTPQASAAPQPTPQ